MKKIPALIFITALILTGCSKTESKQSLKVYSFHGENEQLSVTNGIIVFNDGDNTFYGGDLAVSEDFPSNITTFSTKFYIKSDNDDQIIISNTVISQNNSPLSINTDLGKTSGQGGTLDTADDNEIITDLKNNLYFELVTTDANGEKNIYELQMLLSEVIAEATE